MDEIRNAGGEGGIGEDHREDEGERDEASEEPDDSAMGRWGDGADFHAVIPVKTGIQNRILLGPGLRRGDVNGEIRCFSFFVHFSLIAPASLRATLLLKI